MIAAGLILDCTHFKRVQAVYHFSVAFHKLAYNLTPEMDEMLMKQVASVERPTASFETVQTLSATGVKEHQLTGSPAWDDICLGMYEDTTGLVNTVFYHQGGIPFEIEIAIGDDDHGYSSIIFANCFVKSIQQQEFDYSESMPCKVEIILSVNNVSIFDMPPAIKP